MTTAAPQPLSLTSKQLAEVMTIVKEGGQVLLHPTRLEVHYLLGMSHTGNEAAKKLVQALKAKGYKATYTDPEDVPWRALQEALDKATPAEKGAVAALMTGLLDKKQPSALTLPHDTRLTPAHRDALRSFNLTVVEDR